MTSAEKMVDSACTPNEKPENLTEGALWATHSGEVEIMGHKIKCHILSDGRRIFDAEDLEKFFSLRNQKY